MKKLIIGIVLVVLGLPGTALFFTDLVRVIIGGLPVVLILGGALAVYLGYEELQAEKEAETPPFDSVHPPTQAPETECQPALKPAEPQAEQTPSPKFLGNTDTYVFHSLSCNFAQGKNCTLQFTDRDEAISQGYKPCKVCTP
jgi:hypothetical protein